jgi:imidazolonepropionase-like amidohydrolase
MEHETRFELATQAARSLLLVTGNPLEDLTVLRDQKNLVIIMKDGKVFKDSL